jgi:hypothetical protein
MNKFTHTKLIKIGEACPKALVRIPVWGKGKSGKTPGWEEVHKQVIKDLGRFPG